MASKSKTLEETERELPPHLQQEMQDYMTAAMYGLTLVSYDSDCDRTDRGRLAPAAVHGGP